MGKSMRPLDDRDLSQMAVITEIMQKVGVAKNEDVLTMLQNYPDFFPEGWEEKAQLFYQLQTIRRVQKLIEDENGIPVIASIQAVNGEGETENLWKHEEHWERDDYRQVADFHVNRAQHHIKVAHGVARKARRRYGIQIRIPFADSPNAAAAAAGKK